MGGSWLMAHGSGPMAQGSGLMAQDLWLRAHDFMGPDAVPVLRCCRSVMTDPVAVHPLTKDAARRIRHEAAPVAAFVTRIVDQIRAANRAGLAKYIVTALSPKP